MLKETWKDQYERMHRSHALVQEIGEQNAQPQTVIPPLDVLYHFCCDVFHLRDWIAATLGGADKGKTERLTAKITKQAIRPSLELRACCDVANGSKHLELHGNSYVTNSTAGYAKVVSQDISIGAPQASAILAAIAPTVAITHADGTTEAIPPAPEPPAAPPPARGTSWVQYAFKIDINGQHHDAQNVATKAVAAWEQWLKGNSSIAKQLPDNPYNP